MTRTDGPVNHRVAVMTTARWFADELGFVPLEGISLEDWLGTPTQVLAVQTGGDVFHDGLDELTRSRASSSGIPMTFGDTRWLLSGSAFLKKKRFLVARGKSATQSDVT